MKEPHSSLERKIKSVFAGGIEEIDEQHSKGKLTARERLDLLLVQGSFVEIDRSTLHQSHNFSTEGRRILEDGVVRGHGLID